MALYSASYTPLTGLFDIDSSPRRIEDDCACQYAQPVPLSARESVRFALVDSPELAYMRAEAEARLFAGADTDGYAMDLHGVPMSPLSAALLGRDSVGGAYNQYDDDLPVDIDSLFDNNGYEASGSVPGHAPGACSEEHAGCPPDVEAASSSADSDNQPVVSYFVFCGEQDQGVHTLELDVRDVRGGQAMPHAGSEEHADAECASEPSSPPQSAEHRAFDFASGNDGEQFYHEVEAETPVVHCPPPTPHVGAGAECASEPSSPPCSPDQAHVAALKLLSPLPMAPLSAHSDDDQSAQQALSAMAEDLFSGGGDDMDSLAIAPSEAVADNANEFSDVELDEGAPLHPKGFRQEVLPPGTRRASNAEAAARIQYQALSDRRTHPPTLVPVEQPVAGPSNSAPKAPTAPRARGRRSTPAKQPARGRKRSPSSSPRGRPAPVPVVIDVPSDSEPESPPVTSVRDRAPRTGRRLRCTPLPPASMRRPLSPPAPSTIGVLRVQKNAAGRVVRHQIAYPRPSLLFGAVEAKPGEYPPPLVGSRGGGAPSYHDEHNETLGYTFRTRPNARDFANTLVTNAKNYLASSPCEENQLLLDWRLAMAADFDNEIANIRRMWQAHYNKQNDNPPPLTVCARDITLIFRWLCDCYGETDTSVGLPE